jgi:hypothetical protein
LRDQGLQGLELRLSRARLMNMGWRLGIEVEGLRLRVEGLGLKVEG